MAADNQVVIEGIAKLDALQAEFRKTVGAAEAQLNRLGKDHPVNVTVAQSLIKLDNLRARFTALRDDASIPNELRVTGIEQANARLVALTERVEKLGPALTSATAPEKVAPLAASLERAEGAVGKLSGAVQRGGREMVGALARAIFAADNLQQEIEQAAAAGQDTTKQRARLSELRAEINKATEATGRFRRAQKDAEDAMRRATVAAGENEGQVRSLTDAITLKFPKAEQAIIGFFAALQTFKTSFRETRHVVELFNETFGIDLDKAIRGYIESLPHVAFLLDRLARATGGAAAEAQNLENMQRVLDAAGRRYEPTVEGITAAYAAMESGLRDVTVEILRVSKLYDAFAARVSGASAPELNNRIEALFETLVRFDGSLGNVARSALWPQFQSAVLETARQLRDFGGILRSTLSGEDLERFNGNAAAFEEVLVKGLGGALFAVGSDIERYAKQVINGGRVTQEQADKIVAALEKIIKEIRELPPEEQKSFEARAKQLENYRELFSRFTSDYEKESQKQAKAAKELREKEAEELRQRETRLIEFFSRLREIAADAGAPEEGAAAGALREARAELEAIESKTFFEPEDLERADTLRRRIRELRQEAALAQEVMSQVGETAAAAGQRQSEELRSFVAESEDFRAAFLDLPPIIQETVQELVTGFERSLAVQGANVEETDRFNAALVSLLEQGGQVASDFAQRLAVTSGSVQGMGAAFDVLRSQAESANLAIGATGAATDAAAERLNAVAAAAVPAAAAVDATGESYIRMATHAETAAEVQRQLETQIVKVGDAAERAEANTISFRGRTVEIGEASAEAASSVIELSNAAATSGEAVMDAAQATAKAASASGDLATDASKAASAMGEAADAAAEGGAHLLDYARGAEEAGRATADAAAPVTDLATAAGAAVEPLGQVATALDGIATADPAKTFGDAAIEADKAATATTDLATSVTKVGTTIKEESETIADLAVVISDLGGKLDAAKTKLAAFRAEVQATIRPCQELHECLAAAAAA